MTCKKNNEVETCFFVFVAKQIRRFFYYIIKKSKNK